LDGAIGTHCYWYALLLVRIAIFGSVFSNKLVIKVVSLPTYVNVAHFCVDVVFGLLGVVIFFKWGGFFWGGGNWKCVVEHDVVDGVFFSSVLVITDHLS